MAAADAYIRKTSASARFLFLTLLIVGVATSLAVAGGSL